MFDDVIKRYDPRKLPTHRYPQFITIFEKLVEKHQQIIDRANKMEMPYNTVVAALRKVEMSQYHVIDIIESSIKVVINASVDDSLEYFEKTMSRIGEHLLDTGLHHDGKPSVSLGGTYRSARFSWYCRKTAYRDAIDVYVNVEIPEAGLKDTQVVTTKRSFTSTLDNYQMLPRNAREDLERKWNEYSRSRNEEAPF